MIRGFAGCGKTDPEGGGGFNPRTKPTKSMRALAAEGRFSPIPTESLSFSAASFAPPGLRPAGQTTELERRTKRPLYRALRAAGSN
jgi:hypothetical protein